MKLRGFNEYLSGCRVSASHLCILLGISKRTLQRYIRDDRAPLAIMMIMRSLNDGFPPIKNHSWVGYRIYKNKLIGPQGYEYYEHELRKIDYLRCNGLFPFATFDPELSYEEFVSLIEQCNQVYAVKKTLEKLVAVNE